MLHLHSSELIQWLHANPKWGSIAAFIIAFAESIAIIGSIIPGSVTMTTIGILAGSGVFPLWSIIICGILGAILGDTVSYFIGLYFKAGIHRIWPFSRYPAILIKGQSFILKHGKKSVFLARFLGPIRAIVPLVAGMFNMRPKNYFFASILSAIAWAPAYMLPGILLGAVSLEMPPNIAAGLIVFVSLMLIGIWIIYSITAYAYKKTHSYFANLLDEKWQIWMQQPSKHWFCNLLRHADRPGKRGQILLSINCLISALLFIFIFINVIFHAYLITALNNPIYHLARSLRAPLLDKIMVVISNFGYKFVLLPAVFTLFLWFIVRRHWRTAIHWLANIILSVGLAYTIKHFFYSARPTGILHQASSSSFPSGHTTFAIAFYGLLAYLIGKEVSKPTRKTIYWLTFLLCILIVVSCLYLNAHWFTDILGASFLSLFGLSLIIISYNRKKSPHLAIGGISAIVVITLALAGSWNLYHSYNKVLQSSQIHLETRYIHQKAWWTMHDSLIPPYRVNRLGHPVEILNIQWAGSLNNIKKTLKQYGWHNVHHTPHYTAALKKATFKQHIKKQARLFSKLYNNQPPILEVTKSIKNQSPALILTLWKSNITLVPNHSGMPIWVGTIDYNIPKKKILFFFHHKTNDTHTKQAIRALIPSLLDYMWQIKFITTENLPKAFRNNQSIARIILIKPQLRRLVL